MTRREWEAYIAETYSAVLDHPFESMPDSTVCRHAATRKWFGVFLHIPREKLGDGGSGLTDILNLKCDPLLQGSLILEQGFYPAWHMSKTQWITVVLDECGDDEKVKWLIDMSFDATDTGPGRKKRKRPRAADETKKAADRKRPEN